MNRNILISIGAAVLLAGCSSQSTSPQASPLPAPPTPMTLNTQGGVIVGGSLMLNTRNIFNNVSNSNDHTTLISAIKAAGLEQILKSTGPYTIFAPTNEAFAKLPDGTLSTLLKPANKAQLTKVLTYHIVVGHFTSKDLKAGMKLRTLQGEILTVSYKNGEWFINNAAITIPDITSSNGIIFVINSVLMPK